MSAALLWKTAYKLHYSADDLEGAERAYNDLIARPPEAEEVTWARHQLQIIARLPAHERLRIARRHAGTEAPVVIVDCPRCNTRLRLPSSSTKLAVTCSKCEEHFEVRFTSTGHIHVYQREFNETQRASRGEDPYLVLQVSRTATEQEIKTAYRRRIKEYHPDRVAALGVHLRALAEEESKRINHAYAVLLNRHPDT